MSPWLEPAVLGVTAAMAVVAAVAAWRLYRGLRRIPELRPLPRPASVDRPTVTAVVPARDEARTLRRSVRSLLDPSFPQLQVVVVDDHSSDATGAIADALARADERVRVVHDPPLEPGWLGKMNAMRHGVAGATGELLLFTDADVIHAPGTLRAAVDVLREEDLDLLSLLPRFHVETMLENLVAPLSVLVAQLVFDAGGGTRDPEGAEPLAAGAFILVRRTAFEAAGGFEPIRSAILDDVALARSFRAQGFRVGLRVAPQALDVQLFASNREAFRGSRKHALGGLQGRLWAGPPLLLLALLYFLAAPAAVSLGALLGSWPLLGTGLATWTVQWAAGFAGRRVLRDRPLKRLAYPLGLLPFAACLGLALWDGLVRRRVVWRGRDLQIPQAGEESSR